MSAAISFPTATLDAAALANNLAVVRRFAPRSRVMAVVKADAYGHGLIAVARALADADAYAVARIDEAIVLRESGIAHPIVLLEGVFSAEQLAMAAQLDLQCVVHSFAQIALLEAYRGTHRFTVWLKVDTGMNRLGLRLDELAGAHARLGRCAALGTLRLMTHLASSEQAHGAQTKLQLERFGALAAPLGLECSAANSAGVVAWAQARLDWVRPGLMLYGISPFEQTSAAALGLRPAMTLTTQVIAMRAVPAGEAIGYNGIWRAQRESRIAVAAIGYADCYPRAMRAGAPVLVNGREAAVVGRVSMDMTMIDATELPDARAGDVVTLWGEGLPVERVAPYADTIAYELVCRVAPRVRKVWR